MKSLFLAAALLAGSAVGSVTWAQTATPDTVVTVVPATPIIFTGNLQLPNGVVIVGPWFESQYQVSTDQDIMIIGLHAIVTDVNGNQTITDVNFPQAVFVPANGSWTSNQLYIERLPIAFGTVFSVEVDLWGWIGTADKQVGQLSAGTTFKTQ